MPALGSVTSRRPTIRSEAYVGERENGDDHGKASPCGAGLLLVAEIDLRDVNLAAPAGRRFVGLAVRSDAMAAAWSVAVLSEKARDGRLRIAAHFTCVCADEAPCENAARKLRYVTPLDGAQGCDADLRSPRQFIKRERARFSCLSQLRSDAHSNALRRFRMVRTCTHADVGQSSLRKVQRTHRRCRRYLRRVAWRMPQFHRRMGPLCRISAGQAAQRLT